MFYVAAMTGDVGLPARRRRGGQGAGRASSYDVARLAGVSQSAVSRAFRPGASYISEDMRQKVLAAAEQLGFRPNAMARGLATSRSGIVAVVLGTIGNPVYPAVLQALGRQLSARALQILLLTELDAPETVVQRALQYQAEAMIVTASVNLEPSRLIAARCRGAGLPLVLYNRSLPGMAVPAVTCASREGGRLVADLLLRAGHSRLAVLDGSQETSANIDKREGFGERVAAALGGPPMRETGDFSPEGGRSALLRLMRRPTPPDAVFCTNDIMAIGAIDAARHELGLRIPEDLSVVGFDDIPMAAWPSYGLTTVRQRVDAMAETAVELVCAAIAGQTSAVPAEVPVDLVLRTSARLP